MALPSPTPHPLHNQQTATLVQAELTGGLHGGYIFNRGKLEFRAFWGCFKHDIGSGYCLQAQFTFTVIGHDDCVGVELGGSVKGGIDYQSGPLEGALCI